MQPADSAEAGEGVLGRRPHREDAVAEHGHRRRDPGVVAGGKRGANPLRYEPARIGEAPRGPHEFREVPRLRGGKGRPDPRHRVVRVEDPGGRDRAEQDRVDRVVRWESEDLGPHTRPPPDHDPAPLRGRDVPEAGPEPDLGLVRGCRNLVPREFEAVESRKGRAGREQGRGREPEPGPDREGGAGRERGRCAEPVHQVLDRRRALCSGLPTVGGGDHDPDAGRVRPDGLDGYPLRDHDPAADRTRCRQVRAGAPTEVARDVARGPG